MTIISLLFVVCLFVCCLVIFAPCGTCVHSRGAFLSLVVGVGPRAAECGLTAVKQAHAVERCHSA